MMLKFESVGYSPLGRDDDSDAASLEKLLPPSQGGGFRFSGIRKRPWHRWLPSVLNGIFLCLSLLFFLYSAHKTPTDVQRGGKQLSTYCE